MNRRALSGVLAFGLIVALAACAESTGPTKTPQQVWIDAHPTSVGDSSQCIEFDGEPCDEDPYDLDDWFEEFHKTPAVKKESPRPMKTASQPKPSPRKTRR